MTNKHDTQRETYEKQLAKLCAAHDRAHNRCDVEAINAINDQIEALEIEHAAYLAARKDGAR